MNEYGEDLARIHGTFNEWLVLRLGGLFIFDAIGVGRAQPLTYRTWRAAPDWAVMADVAEDLRRRVVERRITTFVRAGSLYRRSYSEHRVGVYARGRVLSDLRARGFIARALRAFGMAPLAPRRMIFHAQLVRN